MFKPYTAVGLIPAVRGIRKREDIRMNLEHLAHMFKAAAWLSGLDLPVRLTEQSDFHREIARHPQGGLYTNVSQIVGIERRVGIAHGLLNIELRYIIPIVHHKTRLVKLSERRLL